MPQTLDKLYGALSDTPVPAITSDPLPEQRDEISGTTGVGAADDNRCHEVGLAAPMYEREAQNRKRGTYGNSRA